VSGGVERARRFADAIVRHAKGGGCAVKRLLSLVKQLFGGEALRGQRARAVELLLAEGDLSRLLDDVGARLMEALLRCFYLSLGFLERGVNVPRVHARDDLLGRKQVAFVRVHFDNAAGKLGVDIDLVRLDPSVAKDDPEWKAGLPRMRPIGGAPAGADDDDPHQRHRLPPRSTARRSKASRHDGGREMRQHNGVV
jgi:hypothetical protein